ncbi:MAG: NnrS family protein [Geminicoccaceae bacterium]
MPTPPRLSLFVQGFRPFFLAAGIWAPMALAIWIAALAGGVMPPTGLPIVAWHPHELLFGYAGAVVAGFLLTAVPNWTGRLPVGGWRLLLLCLVWLAARLAGLTGGALSPWPAVLLDPGFWLLLVAAMAREIMAGRNWRNLPVIALAGVLGLACLLSQLEALGYASGPLGRRLGLAALWLLIGLIGGRVVPSFTRNWLAKRGAAALPAHFGRLDWLALVVLPAALAVWVALPDAAPAGALLALAGMVTLLRLARWRGLATTAEPLVTVLHLGYAWLGAGLLLLGLGILLPHSVGRLATLHALSAGAIGTMTLAIMTRATLGHTGRALAADRTTVAVYALVQAGALLRVVAPALPSPYEATLGLAALLWGGAFVLFVARYGPLLVEARRPGPG